MNGLVANDSYSVVSSAISECSRGRIDKTVFFTVRYSSDSLQNNECHSTSSATYDSLNIAYNFSAP